jgi:hypothetical protein
MGGLGGLPPRSGPAAAPSPWWATASTTLPRLQADQRIPVSCFRAAFRPAWRREISCAITLIGCFCSSSLASRQTLRRSRRPPPSRRPHRQPSPRPRPNRRPSRRRHRAQTRPPSRASSMRLIATSPSSPRATRAASIAMPLRSWSRRTRSRRRRRSSAPLDGATDVPLDHAVLGPRRRPRRRAAALPRVHRRHRGHRRHPRRRRATPGPCVGPLDFAVERSYTVAGPGAFEVDDPTRVSPASETWIFSTIPDGPPDRVRRRFQRWRPRLGDRGDATPAARGSAASPCAPTTATRCRSPAPASAGPAASSPATTPTASPTRPTSPAGPRPHLAAVRPRRRRGRHRAARPLLLQVRRRPRTAADGRSPGAP